MPRKAVTSIERCAPTAITYGQAETVSAVLAAASTGLPAPTGTVSFLSDGIVVATAALNPDGTAASGPIPGLGAGHHALSAVYSGDATYLGSSSTNADLSVAPAPLTITADSASRLYGSPSPDFTAKATGFVLGQGLGDLTGTLAETTLATAASHAGSYAITPGGVSSSNYAITFKPGTLSITPAPLTVTIDPRTMTHGSAVPTLTASLSGLVNGDTSAAISRQLKLSTAADPRSHVGSYAITASSSDADYVATFTPGTLTVTPAALTITANDATKPYGAAIPFFSARFDGFAAGDGVSSLVGSIALNTTAAATSHAGRYLIVPSGTCRRTTPSPIAPGRSRSRPCPSR